MVKYWTNQEESKLLDLWKNDIEVSEISEILGRTKSSIYNRISILRNIGECGAWYRRVPKNDPFVGSYSECESN